MSIIIALVFWLVGIVVMFGGKIADNFLRRLEKKLKKRSKRNKFNDNSAHIAYGAGGKVVDAIPWFYVNTVCTIVGMVIIALGFVPLSFHFILRG